MLVYCIDTGKILCSYYIKIKMGKLIPILIIVFVSKIKIMCCEHLPGLIEHKANKTGYYIFLINNYTTLNNASIFTVHKQPCGSHQLVTNHFQELTLKTLEAHFRNAWSCPHISSPVARSWIRSPPRSPSNLSTYLPKLQKFGYALEPRANTAKRTLLRGPKLSMDVASVLLPKMIH